MTSTRKPMISRNLLDTVAKCFRNELARLHTAMDWASYKESKLVLEVEYSADKCKWEIRCHAGTTYCEAVRGSDLGIVMDEVYHRLGYNDREEARIDSSMRQLPAPTTEDDDYADEHEDANRTPF